MDSERKSVQTLIVNLKNMRLHRTGASGDHQCVTILMLSLII